jgi:hypothetical protein
MKQSRHVRLADEVWTDNTLTQRAMMLSRLGQLGLDTANASPEDVEVVDVMDRPEKFSHLNIIE